MNDEAFGIKVRKKRAQKLKEYLTEIKLIDFSLRPNTSENHIIFPLLKLPSLKERMQILAKGKSLSILKQKFTSQKKKPLSLKDSLENKLTKTELDSLITSFNVLGNVAIIEIPDALKEKEKIIANSLLEINKNIESVCKISSAHSGKYRTQKVTLLAGKKLSNVFYKESGSVFEIELGKVFFSPRLSTERIRISKLIKKDEIIGALFAGVGPYPIIFAKKSKMKKAYAVELNPSAVELMISNAKLNKVESKIEILKGDVKKVVPKHLKGKCDRVVMPLPKGAEHFLKDAFLALKPEGGVIHFYQFVDKNEPYKKSLEIIKETALKMKKNTRILRKAQVRSFSPSKIQVVIDIKVY
ncbi:MAG: class I SAM-dependent methyltransferase family protein [Candidatus Diapherotrites archaeon]